MRLHHLAHHVPVALQPRRGRPVVTGFGRLTTPVRIPEISLAETRPGPDLATPAGPAGTMVHDGALWIRLAPEWDDFEDLCAHVTDGPLPVRQLLTFTAGTALLRSPLVPYVNRSCGIEGIVAPIPDHVSDRARADLADHAAGNLLLVGGVPHARLRGPLLALEFDHRGASMAVTASACTADATVPTTVHRFADHAAFVLRRTGASFQLKEGHGLAAFPFEDDLADIRHFANAGAEAVLANALWLGRSTGLSNVRDRLFEVARAAHPLHMRALTGTLGLDDLARAVEEVAELASRAAEVSTHWKRNDRTHPTLIRAYADEVALPALRAAPSPEDDEALGALTLR